MTNMLWSSIMLQMSDPILLPSNWDNDLAVPWFVPWSIKLVDIKIWGAETTLEIISLLFSDTTWLFQLIKCVLPSEVKEKEATKSWRETTLWKSLPIVTFETVNVLELELTFSLLLSSFSEVEKSLEDVFLEFSAAETLLEKCLTVWQAHKHPLG